MSLDHNKSIEKTERKSKRKIPIPQSVEYGPSPDPSNYACGSCRWGLLGKSESKEFILCSYLDKWAFWNFYCKHFKHRVSKKRRKNLCVYYIEGTRFSHSRDCDKCLMNPESCPESPDFNPNWDVEAGKWKVTYEVDGETEGSQTCFIYQKLKQQGRPKGQLLIHLRHCNRCQQKAEEGEP